MKTQDLDRNIWQVSDYVCNDRISFCSWWTEGLCCFYTVLHFKISLCYQHYIVIGYSRYSLLHHIIPHSLYGMKGQLQKYCYQNAINDHIKCINVTCPRSCKVCQYTETSMRLIRYLGMMTLLFKVTRNRYNMI